MSDLQEMAGDLRYAVLQRLKVASYIKISPSVIEESGLKVAADFVCDQLLAQLTARVAAEHLATDSIWIEYELPPKVRAWMEKKGKPTGHSVLLKQYAVYPTLPIDGHQGYPAVIPTDGE